MADNKKIVCLDSTHKTTAVDEDVDGQKISSSAFLYTLLVKDKKARKGIPVAHMICNSESQ
jgi:hypothetical protein